MQDAYDLFGGARTVLELDLRCERSATQGSPGLVPGLPCIHMPSSGHDYYSRPH